MPEFNRWDILAAYNVYSQHWGWDAYTHGIQARLARLRYHNPGEETLEALSPNAKEIYGHLVRRHHGHAVAYDRLRRRRPDVFPSWPGTFYVGSHARYVCQRLGLNPAVLNMVAPTTQP